MKSGLNQHVPVAELRKAAELSGSLLQGRRAPIEVAGLLWG
jgi:hypothetical protein